MEKQRTIIYYNDGTSKVYFDEEIYEEKDEKKILKEEYRKNYQFSMKYEEKKEFNPLGVLEQLNQGDFKIAERKLRGK